MNAREVGGPTDRNLHGRLDCQHNSHSTRRFAAGHKQAAYAGLLLLSWEHRALDRLLATPVPSKAGGEYSVLMMSVHQLNCCILYSGRLYPQQFGRIFQRIFLVPRFQQAYIGKGNAAVHRR